MICCSDHTIRLENRYAAIVLDGNGLVLRFTDKLHETELLASPGTEPFCCLRTESGETIVPDRLSCTDGILTAGFGETELRIRAEVFPEFFTFTVLDDLEPAFRSLRFVNFRFGYDFDAKTTIMVSGYAMNIHVDPVFYPGGADKAACGDCYRRAGTKGAKLAVIAAPYEEQRDILKRVNECIPAGDLPITRAGGAYALDFEENHGDYVIISDSDPAKVPGWIDFYTGIQVDQLDFHQGGRTFRQGDFRFHLTGSAEGFRRNVAEPLEKAGIVCGLHTYSFYVDYEASGILTDPRWQKDLEVLHRFTLASPVGVSDDVLLTKESTEKVSPEQGFMQHNTPFLLIDEEIIRFTLADNGFVKCQRGWAGTVPAEHAAGAEIKILGGYYGMIAPVPGSDLFYHVAHETARAYNEGGFGMFYMDALDGISRHARLRNEEDLIWYYTVSFINEIIRYCKRTPMMEYSMIIPSLWVGRGRGGAWDTTARSFKRWNDLHLASNRKLMDRFYTTTFGWYTFYPTEGHYPGNFATKYMYFDDVDYMGTLALAYNQSIVYNGLVAQDFETYPALCRNMERYRRYNSLRKAGAVSETVLQQLRDGQYEWMLREDGDGVSFTEAAYLRGKLQNLADDRGTLRAYNPFGAQKPFIRIENLQSSDGEDAVTLLPLDRERPLREQELSVKLDHLPMKNRLALRVQVYGNCSGDAVCIRTAGYTTSENGVYDFLIRLNFSGWREFILADTDNGEFPDLSFPEKKDGNYAVYRAAVNYDSLTNVDVYLSGDCEGVRMGSIEAVCHKDRPLTDPTVTVDGQSVTFGCTVDSAEYLEYLPGEGAKIYDRYGHAREVAEICGGITVPAGECSAVLSGSASGCGDAAMPARAVLTLGVYGKTIR